MLGPSKRIVHLPNNYEYQHCPDSSNSRDSADESSESRQIPFPNDLGDSENAPAPGEDSKRLKSKYGESTNRRCHHCQMRIVDKDYLQCTDTGLYQHFTICRKLFCRAHFGLGRIYDSSLSKVEMTLPGASETGVQMTNSTYTWKCPHCRGVCKQPGCRKRREAGRSRLRPLSTRPPKDIHGPATTEHTPAQTPDLSPSSTAVSNICQPTARNSIARLGGISNGGSQHVLEARDLSERTRAVAHPSFKGQPPSSVSSRETDRLQLLQTPIAAPAFGYLPPSPLGPRPLSIHDQVRPSHVFDLKRSLDTIHDDDKPVGAGSAKKATPRKAIRKPEIKPKKVDTTVNGAVKGKEENAAKPGQKRKNKNNDEKEKVKAPRVKPAPKPEKPVDPPVFVNMNTRLGREVAEHRIMLREYMVRFQTVLSIPDDSLPPLDEFDRPLSSASVGTFAGAMLDLIKEELESSEGNEKVLELLAWHREELRYSRDLARFAKAFRALTKPLVLKAPQNLVPMTEAAAHTQAVREMLELEEDSEEMEVRTTRRSAALGPIPPQYEVVRMLLALADRTLLTPRIRRDLTWEAPENEARRVYARSVKKGHERFDKIKKRLRDAKVGLKDVAAIKANEGEMRQVAKESLMCSSLAAVNLCAVLGQRALRLESPGVDMDGRVYWFLRYRPIEDHSQPPKAWASGLLVWGIGVPPKPGAVVDEDELPVSVERWCRFGKSSDVRQLANWIEYRTSKAVEATVARLKTPSKTKLIPGSARDSKIAKVTARGTGEVTPRGSDKTPTKRATPHPKTSTPSRPVASVTSKEKVADTTPLGQNRTTPRGVVETPTKVASPRSTKRPRLTLEVVIPLRPRDLNGAGATHTSGPRHPVHKDEDDDDDDDQHDDGDDDIDGKFDSELSDLSSDSNNDIDQGWEQDRKEFLDQLTPAGYKPLIGTIREKAEGLIDKINEVADWLEVLEWKGLGEV